MGFGILKTKWQKLGGGLDVVSGGVMTLNPDLTWIAVLAIIVGTIMMFHPFIVRTTTQKNKSRKEPTLKPEKSKRPTSTEEQDFNHHDAMKNPRYDDVTYTRLAELYRNGLIIKDEHREVFAHLLDDNNSPDIKAVQWVHDVFYELDSSIPMEARKFCSDENFDMGNFSEFEVYMGKLDKIINELSDKLSTQINVNESDIKRISLVELRYEAEELGWIFPGKPLSKLPDFIHGLKQAGVDGTIKFYGRHKEHSDYLTHSNPLIEIDKDYWLEYELQPSILRTGNNFDIDTFSWLTEDDIYQDIHADRDDALYWLNNGAEQYRDRNKRFEDVHG